MPLPPLVKAVAEKKVGEFCRRRIPQRVLGQVRLSFRFRGNSVTIFEERAPWMGNTKEWSSLTVAQMRYEGKTGKWSLYCADRNDRWHEYIDTLPTRNIEELLREIDEDPTGIFWG